MTVRQGTPVIAGDLEARQVEAAFQKAMDSFRVCYAEALRKDPKAAGKVVVSFTVDASTNLAKNIKDAGSTLQDGVMKQCVIGRLGGYPFERSRRVGTGQQKSDVSVRHEFIFSAP